MAQTKKKRSRKHRGTPAGTIDRAGRTGRPRTREEAKRISRDRRAQRANKPPSWRSSINRAAISAPILAAFAVLALGWSIPGGLALAVLMFGLYIPLGYYTDLAVYRFRQRRRAQGA